MQGNKTCPSFEKNKTKRGRDYLVGWCLLGKRIWRNSPKKLDHSAVSVKTLKNKASVVMITQHNVIAFRTFYC